MTLNCSRRRLFKFTAAGAVATLPAAAFAGGEITHLPATDAEQLQLCLDQLRNVLKRIHPNAVANRSYFVSHADGGYALELFAKGQRLEWTGPAFYELRDEPGDKFTTVQWVDRIWNECDRRHGYMAYHKENGRKVSMTTYFSEDNLCLVRKVDEADVCGRAQHGP